MFIDGSNPQRASPEKPKANGICLSMKIHRKHYVEEITYNLPTTLHSASNSVCYMTFIPFLSSVYPNYKKVCGLLMGGAKMHFVINLIKTRYIILKDDKCSEIGFLINFMTTQVGSLFPILY